MDLERDFILAYVIHLQRSVHPGEQIGEIEEEVVVDSSASSIFDGAGVRTAL